MVQRYAVFLGKGRFAVCGSVAEIDSVKLIRGAVGGGKGDHAGKSISFHSFSLEINKMLIREIYFRVSSLN